MHQPAFRAIVFAACAAVLGAASAARAEDWVQQMIEAGAGYRVSELNQRDGAPALVHGLDDPAAWQQRADGLHERFLHMLGGLRERGAVRFEVLDEVRMPRHVRRHIVYDTVDNDRVTAYLLVPNQVLETGTAAPAVIALHPTWPEGKDVVAKVEVGPPGREYGYELAERGYVVLVPDSLTAGERIYEGLRAYHDAPFYKQHPAWSSSGKALVDHQQGVDLLVSLDFVAADRIGAIGHSLGGYNAFFLSAVDERIRAVVCSCGFAPVRGDPRPGRWGVRDWYSHMPLFSRALEQDWVPFEFHEIIALTAPRPFFNYSAHSDAIFPNWQAIGESVIELDKLYHWMEAGDRFVSVMTNGRHDFPPLVREAAYTFLDRWLKNTP